MKVSKSIRINDEAWAMAKSEAGKRLVPLGEFVEAMIRWNCDCHAFTCPNCERDFDLMPTDYIEVLGEVKQ